MLGVAYKRDIGDMRESPALKLIELLRDGRRRTSPTTTRTSPELDELGLASVAARAGRARRGRDRHRPLGHRLRGARRRRAVIVDLRNATGARAAERQGLEAVTRVAHAGLGGWGTNLARIFDELADLAWICDIGRGAAGRVRGPLPAARG